MSASRCCVPFCGKTRSDGAILHFFPNPKDFMQLERFRSWLFAIGGDVLTMDDEEIFKNRRVCHEHFEERFYCAMTRLIPDAVPTLHLSDAMTAGSKQAQPSAREPQGTDNTCMPRSQAQPSAPEPQDTDACKLRTQKTILNPFPCIICKLRFPSRNTLNTHLLSHEYECDMCKIVFSSRKLYLKHKCCICEICNKPCASTSHKNCPKVFTCKCGEKFTRRRDFTMHQKIHVEIYGHCHTCFKQFTSETDLIEHVNEMKFPCIYCGTCFPSSGELSTHNVVHPVLPKHSCKICNETFEDSLSAASHSRMHGAPMRSYSRKPKAVNSQEKREFVNIIVKEEYLSDVTVPIELDKDAEPEVVVKVNLDVDDCGGRLLAKVKEEPCDERFIEDSERVGVTEPKLKRVKVEFEADEETRDANLIGLGIGKPPKRLGGVKVESDLRDDDMNEAIQNVDVVVSGSCTLHKPVTDGDTREPIEKIDVVGTANSSKFYEAVKIKAEVTQEIKKEPDERLDLPEVGFDEVMNGEHDVETWSLGNSATGLYAGHQIEDGFALGPVRVRAPTVYAGKNALRIKTTCKQEPALTNPPSTGLLESSSIKLEPAEMPEEIEAVYIKRELFH